MSPVIPERFLFRFSIPILRCEEIPLGQKISGGRLLNLPKEYRIPDFSKFDKTSAFGDVRMAWNSQGIAVSVSVSGKKSPPHVNPNHPWESDGIHIWLDTRNTQSIHRASRFCHHFVAMPSENGKKKTTGTAQQLQIPRAKEESTLATPNQLRCYCSASSSGYQLELWLPSEVLQGFDPESNHKIGFYYYLRDQELGEQFLSVNQEFPFATDPSLWWTLDLKT